MTKVRKKLEFDSNNRGLSNPNLDGEIRYSTHTQVFKLMPRLPRLKRYKAQVTEYLTFHPRPKTERPRSGIEEAHVNPLTAFCMGFRLTAVQDGWFLGPAIRRGSFFFLHHFYPTP